MRRVSQLILRCFGWEIVGQLPNLNKYIIIVGPHTSNWDFVIGILVRSALAADIRFLGKHQLFNFPFGWFFRAIGGVPVYRNKDNALVEQVVTMFNSRERFVIGLAPEGTRRNITRWRSGFYHIAHHAKIDIVMVGIDFSAKEIILNAPMTPCGDIDQDFPIILDYFRTVTGRFAKEIPAHQPVTKIER
ncbi:MAG: 1-acyl-sn-glycerol-3-phosphate acyltransferase [Gammaproteobacteria bacterium]|nr:1-acyl-sn-glycerol-3-phosphate acyltransferase [Gammaproteobacteria bacterium]